MNVVARPGQPPAAGVFHAAQRISTIGVSEILKITDVAAQRKREGRHRHRRKLDGFTQLAGELTTGFKLSRRAPRPGR